MNSLLSSLNSLNTNRPIDAELERIVEAAISQMQDGRAVDVQRLIDEHPKYAEQLRELLSMVKSLVQLGGEAAVPVAALAENGKLAALPYKQLGDFLLIHELGRGGMGMVYEAEQLSMGRRVALKVLPFAALALDKSLQRFRNEVRAAAALDHPHIVSIYSVGEDRGVHYYAMQLIRGQSLAELIHELREQNSSPNPSPRGRGRDEGVSDDAPTTALDAPEPAVTTRIEVGRMSTAVDSRQAAERYRTAALLGIQAAEALQHAHDQGVLHRDVKPSNLMLDGGGKLYITDFGLARMEADASLTRTGDILGTLRYMAPEQALGERVVVDHRADVYSLGATLYELIGLQPAFTESDRGELVRQIEIDEPTPLRKLDRRIPAELQTIVQKAMAKNPSDRYQTAQELADDLLAFLERRPIKARPPTLLKRATQWSQRHITVVWSALAALLVISVVLAGSTVVIAQLRSDAETNRRRAEEDRTVAVAQRNEARRNQYIAEMFSGQADLEQGNIGRLHQKLIGHLPIGEQADLRGWEWYYLFSKCHPEDRTLFRQRGNEVFARWSPDGKYIAAPGTIWRADTGECVVAMWPSVNLECDLAWSPNASQVAWTTTSDDCAIYLYDLPTSKLVELRGHEGSVWCVAFSPDGKQLVSGSMDHSVRIWDLQSQEVRETFPIGGMVADVKWSPDGELLAVGTVHGGVPVQVWDINKRERIAAHDVTDHSAVKMSWHPSGDLLAVNSPQRWYIVKRSDWSITEEHGRAVRGTNADIEWSPSGDELAIVEGEEVLIWNTARNASSTILDKHMEQVNTVSWSPHGRQLVTADSVREIKLWNLDAQTEPPTITKTKRLRDLAWESDNETLSGTSYSDSSYSRWRSTDGKLIEHVPAIDQHSSRFDSKRRFLAQKVPTDGTTKLVIKDVKKSVVHSVWRPEPSFELLDFTWAPDGSKLAIEIKSAGQIGIEIWSVDDERRVACWIRSYRGDAARFNAVAWSPDSNKIAVEGYGDVGDNGSPYWSSHLHLIDVATGKRTIKRQLGDRPRYGGIIAAFAWSGDGKKLALGSSGGILEIIDVDSGECQASMKSFESAVRAIAWNPDGERVAVAAAKAPIKVIESRGGSELLSLPLASGYASHLAWSPDGKRLAATAGGGTIQIWDASRGYEFTPNGRRQGELAWAYYLAGSSGTNSAAVDAQKMALACAPPTADYRLFRGRFYAELSQFEAAAREFDAVASRNLRQGFVPAIYRAYAFLGAGDMDSYRKLRAELFAEFGAEVVWSRRVEVIWLFILSPQGVEGLKEAAAVIDAEYANNPKMAEESGDESMLLYGAMLYRLGQLEKSQSVLTNLLNTLDSGANTEGQYTAARAKYFLALVRHQLGHSVQARRYFAEANSAKEMLSQMTNLLWSDKVVLDTLQREASVVGKR